MMLYFMHTSAIYVGIVLNDHDFSETIQFGMIDCVHLRSDWNIVPCLLSNSISTFTYWASVSEPHTSCS